MLGDANGSYFDELTEFLKTFYTNKLQAKSIILKLQPSFNIASDVLTPLQMLFLQSSLPMSYFARNKVGWDALLGVLNYEIL